MSNVLIIEDEIPIALEIEKTLHSIGYENIEHVATKKDALEVLQNNDLEYVVSDINLEGEFEGIEIAKVIEREHPNIQLIFLTSYVDNIVLEAISKIKHSSYIVKPFKRHDLETAVKLASFKKDSHSKQNMRLNDDFVFDETNAKLICCDKEFQLSKKEIVLLKCFNNSHNQIVDFDQVDDKVWGYPVESNIRRNLIYRLHSKLPKKLLISKQGLGYKIKT